MCREGALPEILGYRALGCGVCGGLLPSQRHTNPEHSSLPRPPKVSKIMANTYAKLLFNILYFGV